VLNLAQSSGVNPENLFSPVADQYNCSLALHTSSSELGLAIVDPSGTMRWQTWNLGRELSTQLHSCLQTFLNPHSWEELAWLVVTCGPGSFTSTRMGMVVARTLAQQLNIPLFAVSSLAAIAWGHCKLTPTTVQATTQHTTDVAVQMPAQRGEVYGAIYRLLLGTASHPLPSLTAVLPDAVMPLPEWQKVLSAWHHPYYLVMAEEQLGTSVTSIMELAQLDWHRELRPHWSDATPFYGQHPVR